jgi:predicted Zn-dependent peptidase
MLGRRAPSIADLGRLTSEDADRWVDQRMRPDGATLFVLGDVDPEKVRTLVSRYFWKWQAGAHPRPELPPAPIPPRKGPVVVSRPDATLTEVLLGCRLPDAEADERETYEVAARYTGSRIFRRLRGDLGASYGASAHLDLHRGGTAAMVIAAQITNERLPEALRAIDDFFRQSGDGEIDEPALALAHFERARSDVLRFDSSQRLLATLLRTIALGDDPVSLDATGERLARVTKQGVGAALRACRASLTAVLSGREASIQAALRSTQLASP